MRRAALFVALLGFVAAGVGCNVVTGQHDCTYDPSYMELPPTNTGKPQFPTVGSPYTGVVASPPADMPMGR
ncbi:MAG: hypothetical protein MUF18_03390 [Fimbriiglobus sp.]|jgi:hypothetical protein|nr:hypothetical protein [Fimbriiglobus sp.]